MGAKSTDSRHPAFALPFPDLVAGLEEACARGMVCRRSTVEPRLDLYVYANRCVYEDGWDQFSLLARGLILDPITGRVVAAPFPKFFNVGEKRGSVPDLPFEAFEKLDGSLIIAFHHDGQWRAATKGAFFSEQARWAQARLDAADLSPLVPGTTYLFEAVYPENRIVVHYEEPALVGLGAYGPDGREFSYAEMEQACAALGWRAARRYAFASIADMVAPTDYHSASHMTPQEFVAAYRRANPLLDESRAPYDAYDLLGLDDYEGVYEHRIVFWFDN